MALTRSKNLYQEVLTITTDYLGPAAERFVTRQIENHLDKPAENLTRADMPIFIEWATAALSVLTNKKEVRQEYLTRLRELTNKSRRS